MVYRIGKGQRTGFTILETMIAFGILATALVMTAQLGTWSMLERSRTQMRLEGAEAAANVLEAARSLGWQQLAPDWAQQQKLADYASARLADAQLVIHVEEQASGVKRVEVEIQWPQSSTPALRSVLMIAYFGNRGASPVRAKP
jgi:type II secretory pathway pseudopilin PulG